MKNNNLFLCPLFLIIFTYCSISFSQESAPPAFELKPYFAAITVENIDSSITWYKQVLGLELRNRVDSPERGFIQAILTGNGLSIELVELKSMVKPADCLKNLEKGTELIGFYKIGFVVEDFDNWVKFLEERSANFYGSVVTDKISNQRTFLISDSDGNLLQFFDKH